MRAILGLLVAGTIVEGFLAGTARGRRFRLQDLVDDYGGDEFVQEGDSAEVFFPSNEDNKKSSGGEEAPDDNDTSSLLLRNTFNSESCDDDDDDDDKSEAVFLDTPNVIDDESPSVEGGDVDYQEKKSFFRKLFGRRTRDPESEQKRYSRFVEWLSEQRALYHR